MRRGIGIGVALLLVVALAMPALVEASTSTVADLVAAIAYWQEQAVVAAVERDKLKEELARMTADRDALLQDRSTLEEIVGRLQSERNRAMDNARAEAALRQMAERDLDMAISTVKSLQEALQRLAGPRFGLIVGATYDPRSRDPALLAAVQVTFK